MATTLDDSGIIFPDASTQTTAVDLTSDIDVTGTITADGLTVSNNNGWAVISSNVGSGGVFNVDPVASGSNGLCLGWNGSNGNGESNLVAARSGNLNGGFRFHDYNTTTDTYTERLRIAPDGDIYFFEDTGSSVKFKWDASTERLGIGTSSPTSPLTIKSNSLSSTTSGLAIQANSSTNDLIRIGEKSTDGGRFHMYEAGVEKIAFYTDGTNNHISAGNLGIGTSSPTQKLDVNGTVKATAFSGPGVATVSSSGPATNTNGSVGDIYANSTTGQMYVCTDATSNNNIWRNVGKGTDDVEPINYPTATGGTVTTSGNYKIHTFTSSGTFTVSDLGNQGTTFDFLVVAGGGGGGGSYGGGGGAGGYRTSAGTSGANTSAESSKTLSATSYTITVGAGGGGGANGGNSSALGVTSTGGGRGGAKDNYSANSGGSGGGADYGTSSGSGTSGQGKNGGGAGLANGNSVNAGGGGGASANGGSGGSGGAGDGGNGLASSITGSSVTRAGGGAGNYEGYNGAAGPGTGGSGGGGNSRATGTANTGGGGGGNSKAGGSGIVIIRYQYQ